MKKLNTSDIQSTLIGFDLFICSSSFESRCLEIANKIDTSQFKSSLICHFEDNYDIANLNLEELKTLLQPSVEIVILQKNDPLKNFDHLVDFFETQKPKSVLIDISTLTLEMCLIFLQIFRKDIFYGVDITLCYNPSDKYSTLGSGNINELWLSKGVQNIRSVLGYPGDFSPINETMLIVLVGFESDRSQILIDNFEPHKLYIGKASAGNSKNSEIAQINLFNFEKLIKQNPSANDFEFSCIELEPTISILSQIIDENKSHYNIVICPMSNKLSTLAVASIAFRFPEIQICYSSTNQYNIEAYSVPSNFICLFDFKDLI